MRNSVRTGFGDFSVIPEGEVPCRWMEIGVISYKLCDLKMQCGICPLDQALRGKKPGVPLNWEGWNVDLSPIFECLKNCHIDTRRLYHPGQTWIWKDPYRGTFLGLNHLVISLMESIDSVTLPGTGDVLRRGEPFGRLASEAGEFDLVAPAGGKVVRPNPALESSTSSLFTDPLGEGWLLEVAPDDLDGDKEACRTGMSVLGWTVMMLETIQSYVKTEACPEHSEVGLTMADGGLICGRIKDVLSREARGFLFSKLLGPDDWKT
jgi:glycine cleavage system H lipoate-binding protein